MLGTFTALQSRHAIPLAHASGLSEEITPTQRPAGAKKRPSQRDNLRSHDATGVSDIHPREGIRALSLEVNEDQWSGVKSQPPIQTPGRQSLSPLRVARLPATQFVNRLPPHEGRKPNARHPCIRTCGPCVGQTPENRNTPLLCFWLASLLDRSQTGSISKPTGYSPSKARVAISSNPGFCAS
jgi:hypothetical protein